MATPRLGLVVEDKLSCTCEVVKHKQRYNTEAKDY